MTTYKQDEIKDALIEVIFEVMRKGSNFTAFDFKWIMEHTPNKILDAIEDKSDERKPF